MNQIRIRSVALSLIMSFLVFSSCGNNRTDSEIQVDVTQKLSTIESAGGISATVADGVVTLTGECSTQDCINKAESEVKSVKGVKEVRNDIRMASLPGADAPVEISSDPILTTAVNEVVQTYSSVKAEVKDGVVTLRGEIERSQLQDLMQKLNNLQVKKIDNQLVVK